MNEFLSFLEPLVGTNPSATSDPLLNPNPSATSDTLLGSNPSGTLVDPLSEKPTLNAPQQEVVIAPGAAPIAEPVIPVNFEPPVVDALLTTSMTGSGFDFDLDYNIDGPGLDYNGFLDFGDLWGPFPIGRVGELLLGPRDNLDFFQFGNLL
ncbi:hypothetical protein [Lyngbya aestuarii]|uniref:hypothetical protein n=1 Tax=Lyngbya aestuarii TaxID=118322 RepID=UPI00403E1632